MSADFWIKDMKADGKVAFVAAGGRIGTSAAQEFLSHCQGLLSQGKNHVVVDMHEVEFIASSGAGTLVVLSEEFRAKGGSVQILRASAAVKRVIDLLNIDRFVELVADETEALANV